MAQKIVELPGIGTVTLAKRRGSKNLRLSIQPDGRVRVGLPVWAPYSAGISFALSRADWIRSHTATIQKPMLKHGQRIGKSYRLEFMSVPSANRTQARLGINSITISSNLALEHQLVQNRAAKAAERALKKEAEALLGARLKQLSARHSLPYKSLRIKKLSSRWGSCSSQAVITLNYFLIQLPWNLIDYVIVHELAHTRHLNHSRDFWALVEGIIPDAKGRRRQIKNYRPIILPN